ncbi:MAG TPA: GtrA family protein [Candidatus Onthenecus intestinigallinarum]|uniref:GtrA family protein n=1 Tax=Candidatus Onthenecus intestinigallinarum TaxID=2840875 RepID=A0A9D0ZBU7_9FIRM|nr:GtrA family protein [Candidatus Onthenecus intestinigallinarum]
MQTIRKYVDKVRKDPELLRYIVIGVCTTAVNYVVYLLARAVDLHYMAATVLASVVAILFAYVANKLYVFRSHTDSLKAFAVEFFNFVLMRVISLGANAVLMKWLVDGVHIDDRLAQILVQFIVVALNYVFSKLYIFKPQKKS